VSDLTLGSRVLDRGLDALRTEADKLITMSGVPTDYADAIAKQLGEAAVSFGAVQDNAGGGRKITCAAISNGTITTGGGTVTQWAVIDSVNSRLLVDGDLTGDQATVAGQTWTLDSITIALSGDLLSLASIPATAAAQRDGEVVTLRDGITVIVNERP
jgi:hypothetical protein